MRRIGLFAAILASAAGLLAVPTLAGAQCAASGAPANCGVPGSVSMTAGRIVRLLVSAGSTALTAPTTADFDAGLNSTTGPTLTVSANAGWTLSLRASSAFWAASNTSPGAPARTDKPAADLMWSTAANGSFTSLSTSDVNLVTGSATASDLTSLYFQTLYDWTLDTPGSYSLSVVLTLTSP